MAALLSSTGSDLTSHAFISIQVAYPVGLQNLGEWHELAERSMSLIFDPTGNTCYMNSTVQVLRAIPELQDALNT